MSATGSSPDDVRDLLREMVAESNALKRTAGDPITDAVAGWLSPQYLLAAREKLAATDKNGRFEVLRTFVQDWALLRHGDHAAERLRIERERLKLAERDLKQKWDTKIEAGLEAIVEEIKHNPKAMAAYNSLAELVCAESQPRQEKEFREWLQQPEIRKEVLFELTRGLSPETLKKVEEELCLL